jgi:glycosyltransferase involved in cell wall biosynthesis
MKICAVMKYPPIQGGVSAQCFWLARGLADAGHQVVVVTNAEEVDEEYRLRLLEEDRRWLEYTAPGGGQVRLWNTVPSSLKYLHIPQSKLFVSRLASLATDAIRRHGCELIFSYYFEPYVMASHLASAWTGVPYVAHHAGSDLGRLMNQPDLATAYREIVRRADGMLSKSLLTFLGLGVAPEALYPTPSFYLPRQHFNPEVEPLNLNAHLEDLRRQEPGLVSNPRPVDTSLPTVGIYGKMGEPKGSFDLLAALGKLRREGLRFNFVAVTRGRSMERYFQAVKEQGLEEVTWVLPFMPHWKIARFIRSCTAVCFLERDFPVSGHAPTIPTEVLACGTCLVLSGEIAARQSHEDPLVPGENFLLVEDPRQHETLAAALRRAIEAPDQARQIGLRGAQVRLSRPEHREVVAEYERIFEDVLRRRRGEPSVFTPEERGLTATRPEATLKLVPALRKALGEVAEREVQAWLQSLPPAPSTPVDDALGFCRHIQAKVRQDPAQAKVQEAARFSELLIWQTKWDEEEARAGLFSRLDAVPLAPGISGGGEERQLSGLAPLRSNWLKVARFRSLPPGVAGLEGEAPEEGEYLIAFHKQPNMRGHHFRINRWTAELLERSDGTRTVAELVRELHQRSGKPQEEVIRRILPTLRRFYREGMILFVHPRPAA